MRENSENGKLKSFFKNSKVQKILIGILIYFLMALIELLFHFYKLDFDKGKLIEIIKNSNNSCL